MIELIRDNWNGRINDEQTIKEPSLSRVIGFLDALDQDKRTSFSITIDSCKSLTVGGGLGKYVVYVTDEDGNFHSLTNDDALDGTIMINIGGQEGDYDQGIVVNKTVASEVIEVFISSEKLDPRYVWECN